MASFDDRENAFETKFAHDADMVFKATARRNKLLGLWAADLLGKTGDDAQDYAAAVVKSDFQEAGDDDVFRKICADLDGKSDPSSIRAKMADLLTVAKAQIAQDG